MNQLGRRLSSLALFALCGSLVGCTLKKRERGADDRKEKDAAPEAPAAAPADFGPNYAVVKKALLESPKSCFLPDAAICLDDDALIAEVFASVMKRPGVVKRFGSALPGEGAELRRLLPQIQQSYRLAQQKTPARREAITKQVEKRYHNPIVSLVGSNAVADLGYLPGPLTAYRNTFRMQDSPLGNGRSWRATEISRNLTELAAHYPGAMSLRLLVKAPNFGGFQKIEVSYQRSSDRIRFDNETTKSSYYLSKKLGGDFSNLKARGISLSIHDMHSCSTKGSDFGGLCTPALD